MDEIAKKLAELAEKYGPHTIEAVRGATQIEAYSTLAGGVMSITIACIVGKCGLMLWNTQNKDDFDRPMIRGAGVVFAVIALIIAMVGIRAFADPWTWVAINNPDLWIAKRVFKL